MKTKLLSVASAALVATTGFSHAGGFVGVRAGPVAVRVGGALALIGAHDMRTDLGITDHGMVLV